MKIRRENNKKLSLLLVILIFLEISTLILYLVNISLKTF